MAVQETGFGVVEHKVLKNLACSHRHLGRLPRPRLRQSPGSTRQTKIVSVPRPAGVVLALTPSTNPVATVYSKIMLSLLTRNTIILSPHPYAKDVCNQAATVMAEAAVAAGAPDGCVQVVAEPSIPLVNALMTSERVSVILATGGTAMVRAAYSSCEPGARRRPGQRAQCWSTPPPTWPAAARVIIASKSFDNAILCTNESVLIAVEEVADTLVAQLVREGGYLASPAETDAIRGVIFDGDRLRTEWIGRDATAIAAAAGVRVPARTTVLLTPIDLAVPEEMLAHEKLLPVLAVVRVPTARRGIAVAQSVLRITGQGHSAAIHSEDPALVMDYAAALRVLRVSVNVGNSLGSSGFETNLDPTMTIGTGFFGRSSLSGNLAPSHLVHDTQVAYASDPSVGMPSFAGLQPWHAPSGAVPAYPVASNLGAASQALAPPPAEGSSDELREHIRRLIVEELRAMVKG